MNFLVGFIARSPWGIQILLYAIAALIVVCLCLGAVADLQVARLDTAKAEKQTLAVQLQGLGNQVAAQNGAVDQMLANAAKAAERLKAAQIEAGKVRVVTQERIQYVQLAAIPTACPEAVTWGATHAVEIGKRWQEAAP